MHLAQLNVGRLVAETDDPRVAEFMAALDRVNGLGKRMPGFVWMMEGSGEPGTGNTEAKIGGDPRFVANLTVWESVEALENFVWNTVHRQFYERRAEWFEVLGEMHLVMWWVPEGYLRARRGAGAAGASAEHGDSDHAFGWAHLRRPGSGASGIAPWRRSRAMETCRTWSCDRHVPFGQHAVPDCADRPICPVLARSGRRMGAVRDVGYLAMVPAVDVQ